MMNLSKHQLEAFGKVASLFSSWDEDGDEDGAIKLETINLHDGTTVALKGISDEYPRREMTILVSTNGQTADLSNLGDVTVRKAVSE